MREDREIKYSGERAKDANNSMQRPSNELIGDEAYLLRSCPMGDSSWGSSWLCLGFNASFRIVMHLPPNTSVKTNLINRIMR